MLNEISMDVNYVNSDKKTVRWIIVGHLIYFRKHINMNKDRLFNRRGNDNAIVRQSGRTICCCTQCILRQI